MSPIWDTRAPLINIAGLVLAFLILQVALVGFGRMLARRGSPAD